MGNYEYFLLHDAIIEYFFAALPLISLVQIIWLLIFEVFYTPQGVVINCVFFSIYHSIKLNANRKCPVLWREQLFPANLNYFLLKNSWWFDSHVHCATTPAGQGRRLSAGQSRCASAPALAAQISQSLKSPGSFLGFSKVYRKLLILGADVEHASISFWMPYTWK